MSVASQFVVAQTDCENLGNACPHIVIDCTDVDDPQQETCCSELDCAPPDNCCNPIQLCCPCEGVSSFADTPNGDLVPLTDFTKPNYIDQAGGSHPLGLYVSALTGTPFKTNNIDDTGNSTLVAHFNAGKLKAAGVVPRNEDGVVDHNNGLIGVISIGFSNPSQEFGNFLTDYIICPTGSDPSCPGNQASLGGMNDRLVFVNGAEPTKSLCDWETVDLTDDENPWGRIIDEADQDGTLLIPGFQPGPAANDNGIPVDVDHIQVAWVKLVIESPAAYCLGTQASGSCCNGCCPDSPPGSCTGESCDLCGDPTTPSSTTGCRFPNFMEDGELPKYQTVLKELRARFPSLQLVLITSRAYGAWSNEEDATLVGDDLPDPCGGGSQEPYAYQNGFTQQRMLFEQIFNGTMNFGPTGLFPFILAGPYIWSNGTKDWLDDGVANPGNAVILNYESALGRIQWPCFKSCADGIHPSRDADVASGQISGQREVANRLFEYFENHPLTQDWFLERPVLSTSTEPRFAVDRLQDRDAATGEIAQGITSLTVSFNEAVLDATTGGSLTPSSFLVAVTGGVAPTISSVTNPATNQYLLSLSRPIPPGEWTTFTANVTDTDGHVIRAKPWDRVTLGFLPGDVDNNGTTNSADHDLLVSWITGGGFPADPKNWDINRSGGTSPTVADKTRLEQLFQGINTSRAWLNVSLPPKP